MKKRESILVSACLLGAATRYDGQSIVKLDLQNVKDKYNFIPFCPEVYGGLPTPRTPSERVGDRVLMKNGEDVTENFRRGAEEAYRLCLLFECKIAVLKEKSPSCGKGQIYDGSFSGRLTEGDGYTTEYLTSRGIRVLGESEFLSMIEHGGALSKLLKKGQ